MHTQNTLKQQSHVKKTDQDDSSIAQRWCAVIFHFDLKAVRILALVIEDLRFD
jgi:hypothetical protein